MTTLKDNEETEIRNGRYAFKTTGALDLQWSINNEPFSTVTDGSFSSASDGVIDLPWCMVKAVNATTETITLKPVT